MATEVRLAGARGGEGRARARRRGVAFDLSVVAAAVGLVVAAALVGWALLRANVDIFLFFPPLLASWAPHVGPGTLPAVLVAVLVVAFGPRLAARMRWRVLLVGAYLASVAWTVCLALVDGYTRGIAARLIDRNEYLHDVPLVGSIPAMLRQFSAHILTGAPQHWTTQVGAHPPGVFLFYVVVDRIGLGGGGAAGIITILIGASACLPVVMTLRMLGGEPIARAALPFGVLLPGAVWVGVSADGMFAAVLAWGVALLTCGAVGRGGRADVAALSGGLLLGATLYLSYGLTLGMLLPAAVIVRTRGWRAALFGLASAGLVVAAFTAAGFWWWTGYQKLTTLYSTESIATTRPYWYFVWADLAAFCFAVGPAALAGLRRVAAAPRQVRGVGLLVAAVGLAVVVADLSGYSKGEVERIWLPFAVWLVAGSALLPPRHVRAWLAAQAALALLVNHLLLTPW